MIVIYTIKYSNQLGGLWGPATPTSQPAKGKYGETSLSRNHVQKTWCDSQT